MNKNLTILAGLFWVGVESFFEQNDDIYTVNDFSLNKLYYHINTILINNSQKHKWFLEPKIRLLDWYLIVSFYLHFLIVG